jgi:flagellar biosynthetic protein FliS
MMDMMQDPMAKQRYETVDMLYSGVSEALGRLETAIMEKRIEDSANNLGDALEGITILMDAVDVDAGGDAGAFLKGLYASIFANLSTVLVTRDVEAVKRSTRYFRELRDLWRNRVLEPAASSVTVSPETVSSEYQETGYMAQA